MAQWQAKSQALLNFFTWQNKKYEAQLRQVKLLEATQKRLRLLSHATQFNLTQLENLLDPFLNDKTSPPHPSERIQLNDKIPSRLGALTYFDLIFRDWSWENNEIPQSLQIIEDLLPPHPTDWDELFVLGGGAARLLAELALRHPEWQILSVDINPLLGFTAQAMLNEKSWELYEIPVSPVSLEDSAVKRQVKNPLGKIPNLSLVFADALNFPVHNESIPAIMTPWLIDVIPMDFGLFSRRINTSLKMGGEWINFGPLGFRYGPAATHYSTTEIQELLIKSGFEIMEWQERQLPYLQSPHSGHWRQEKIWAFRARKIKKSKQPGKYHYLPPWLIDHQLPIPQETFLHDVSMQSRFQFEILTAVDGKNSINTIINMMSEHYGMSSAMAREALLRFLIRIYEEAEH